LPAATAEVAISVCPPGERARCASGAGDPRGDAEWSLAEVVTALQAARGLDLIAAVTVLAEIGDLSRFGNPRQPMGFLGLEPSERSTGQSVKHLGHQSVIA
jgi:transposase